jgi:hypothetical protein
MSVLVDLDFTKETLSKTILDFFRNGLQGNPDQSGSKQTYEECLRTLSQGKKLQYGAANYLLLGIVRSLGIENSPPDDEFLPGERQDDKELGIDPTMSQIMADASSQKKKMDTTQDQDDTIHGSEEGASGSKLAKSGDEAKNDKSDRTEKQVSRTTMPKKKSYAASMPEAIAPEAKNADLITQRSATSSGKTEASQPTPVVVMVSASHFIRTRAEARCNIRHAHSRNAVSST